MCTPRCQSAGGDLASIHTWEVNKFILDTWGENTKAWVGGTDADTEGAWTWSNGVPFEYNFWADGGSSCSGGQNNDKDCLFLKYGYKGKMDDEVTLTK